MARRLLLLSHAPTAATRRAAFAADEPILDAWTAAALRLRDGFGRMARVASSPARSALGTVAALGLEATVEPALDDLAIGRWRGSTLDEVAADDPAGLAAWLGDPDAVPHGGESLTDLARRVSAWLAARLPDEGTTLAVTHAAVLRAAVLDALGAPPSAFWRIDAAPLTCVELSGDGVRWVLRGVAPGPRTLRAAGAGSG